MSNVDTKTLFEVLNFLPHEDIGSCHLVCKKWDRFIKLGEWHLPQEVIDCIEFLGNYDVRLRHGVEHDLKTLHMPRNYGGIYR